MPATDPKPTIGNLRQIKVRLRWLGDKRSSVSFRFGRIESFPRSATRSGRCRKQKTRAHAQKPVWPTPDLAGNITAMQIPWQCVNDIFITHLHVDHYGELPYLYAFAPWMGRWKPLRVHGPSGRRPDLGTEAMIEGMKTMTNWHTVGFMSCPVGDGYEVEVNEFDYKDDGGVCYEKNGVTIRHWRRSHNMDGASGYRLDWNGLSFVWTGDGRPDTTTIKMCQGVDVFVTESQADTARVTQLKTGLPQAVYNLTIDTVHTDHYATGYMIDQVQPRMGMVTHLSYDHDLVAELLAGVRVHWKGLFTLGAPDGVVVNVTKDAIWTRETAMPESANPRRPSTPAEMRQWLGDPIPATLTVPTPAYTIDKVPSADIRATEIDPKLITPQDVQRPLVRKFPNDLAGKEIPIGLLYGANQVKSAGDQFSHGLRNLEDAASTVAFSLVENALPSGAAKDTAEAVIKTMADRAKAAGERMDELRASAEDAGKRLMTALQAKDKQAIGLVLTEFLADLIQGAGGIVGTAQSKSGGQVPPQIGQLAGVLQEVVSTIAPRPKASARAVSERTESTGGFPNRLSSDSWFPPREGGGGDGAFR